MNQRKRKQMTMHKVLHPRYSVDRVYESIKENSVDGSIKRCEDYTKKCKKERFQTPETIQTIKTGK